MKRFFGRILRQGIGVTALAAIMTVAAGAGNAAQAAGSTAIVANSLTPNNCGKYTAAGFTSLAAAITATPSGTILVCPGDYVETVDMVVPAGGKLTIKRALTTDGSRPLVEPAQGSGFGIRALNAASLTVDGLSFYMATGTQPHAYGLFLDNSPAVVRNTTIIGGANTFAAVWADASASTTTKTVTITNSAAMGFTSAGVYAKGPVKLVVSGSIFDASDGGRVAAGADCIIFDGTYAGSLKPSGSITGNTIMNVDDGVTIQGASGVTIANNTISNGVFAGVLVQADNSFQTDNAVKITGNTISGMQQEAIYVTYADPTLTATVLKMSVSKNLIEAPGVGGIAYGLKVTNSFNHPELVTMTVSGNTFYAYGTTPYTYYFTNDNGNATVTLSGNDHTP